jgi:hypothetical protein
MGPLGHRYNQRFARARRAAPPLFEGARQRALGRQRQSGPWMRRCRDSRPQDPRGSEAPFPPRAAAALQRRHAEPAGRRDPGDVPVPMHGAQRNHDQPTRRPVPGHDGAVRQPTRLAIPIQLLNGLMGCLFFIAFGAVMLGAVALVGEHAAPYLVLAVGAAGVAWALRRGQRRTRQLAHCPACGAVVSLQAAACPRCGQPFRV